MKQRCTIDREAAHKLLFEERVSLKECALKLGVSADQLVLFCKRNGINITDRKVNRKSPKRDNSCKDKCEFCNKYVTDVKQHYSRCYVKSYFDYLVPYTEKILIDISSGLGLNRICDRLGLDSTRSRVESFLNRIGVDHKSYYNSKNVAKETFKDIGNPGSWPETKNKVRETCLTKYGVSNVFIQQSVIEKSKKTKLEKYGTLCNTNGRIGGRLSKPHKMVSDILTSFGVDHINEHIKLLSDYNLPYRPIPDIFIPCYNSVIEVYGDFWHANPNKYVHNDVFNTFEGRMTAKEIWDKDAKRLEIFKNVGIAVYVVWESEITKGKIYDLLSNIKDRASELQ